MPFYFIILEGKPGSKDWDYQEKGQIQNSEFSKYGEAKNRNFTKSGLMP
jgi:hypothetical protein